MTLQISNFQINAAQKRATLDRTALAGAQVTHIRGQFLVQNSGEALVTANFPVKFGEKPGFSFGAEIDENGSLTGGYFPSHSVTVGRWLKTERLPGIFMYTGAVLAVVVDNNPGWMWIHWHMEGLAFRNPLNGVADPSEAI